MAVTDIIMPAQSTNAPIVRSIRLADLKEALREGWDDFLEMPTHVPFLILIYPIVGLLLASASFDQDMIPLLYPIVSGLALIGPLSGIFLFELSRRRELGMDTSWRHAFDVVHSPSFASIAAICLLLVAIFGIWIVCAQAIYNTNFGIRRITSAYEFARLVLTTPEGFNLIVLGNIVGFVFAIAAATLSVISLPLLLDRNVGYSAAILTSLKVVARNPFVMAVWGLIVVLALLLGALPLFIGLAVVFPVLGHATWHLYRKVIEPDPTPRPDYQPQQKGPRYAAEFPASMFFRAKDGEKP